MCKFRTLRADEIEVRVQSVKNGKARHLLYINSRAVTNLLDETVGSFNWVSEFYEVCGRTICRIGIWDKEKEQFIYKSDTGSESNVEGDKGLISDCYKRCLSRWGVTELYTSPKIEMPDDGFGNGGYSVSEVTINEQRQITHLVLVNRFGKEVFRWDKGEQQTRKTAPTKPQEPAQATATQQPQEKERNPLTFEQAKEHELGFMSWLYSKYQLNKAMDATKVVAEFYDCDYATVCWLRDQFAKYVKQMENK
ncbi:MAG: hypothetical protein IKA26_04970 [Alistipes sp.]|nr:hypothetical protein [Alistipes sp.]